MRKNALKVGKRSPFIILGIVLGVGIGILAAGHQARAITGGGDPVQFIFRIVERVRSDRDGLHVEAGLRDLLPFDSSNDETAEDIEEYIDIGDVEDVVDAYHEKQNAYMNAKIKALVTAENIDEIDRMPELNAQSLRGNCVPESIATLCVARTMVYQFSVFQEAMNIMREQAVVQAQQKILEKLAELDEDDEVPTGSGFDELASGSAEAIAYVDNELAYGEKTLEVSLNAYQELKIAWPLHTKYGELIDSLEEYRDDLSSMRSELVFYPGTFHNVSTPSCQ